jgi:hypothetical protein
MNAVKEQALRLARCDFNRQWEERDAEGNTNVAVRDQKIVGGALVWHR